MVDTNIISRLINNINSYINDLKEIQSMPVSVYLNDLRKRILIHTELKMQDKNKDINALRVYKGEI